MHNLQIPVRPFLKCIRLSGSTTLFERSFVSSTGRMVLNFVRLSIKNIDAAAIGLPSRLAGSKALVRIGNAFVVFFSEFVFNRVRRRIPTQPEVFLELFSLLRCAEAVERFLLIIS